MPSTRASIWSRYSLSSFRPLKGAIEKYRAFLKSKPNDEEREHNAQVDRQAGEDSEDERREGDEELVPEQGGRGEDEREDAERR